ncbi:hypothetical protein GGQ11_003071 [Salinibacter ruber]|nr:hypothetical protein [Salinibacter ruber]
MVNFSKIGHGHRFFLLPQRTSQLGLHTGPGDDKIELAQDIKNVEDRLDEPSITLNSFILSPPPTGRSDLDWDRDESWFRANNVLFMNNSNYVQKVFDTLGVFDSTEATSSPQTI